MAPPPESKKAETRRPHTKSRTGCLICKKRRVKCDEGRPRCRNCSFADRPCSYPRDPRDRHVALGTSSASPASPASATDGVSDGAASRRSFCAEGTFTLIHMNLFHHAHSHMAEFLGIRGDAEPLIDIAVRSSRTEPFYLDQLLAVAGLHLATQEPHARRAYRHEATELQTRALGSFNKLQNGGSDANYLATFLFATFLGTHMLHESLVGPFETLSGFILTFVNYTRLHRGVRTVTNVYWEEILQSHLRPLLYLEEISHDPDTSPMGHETTPFREFLESMSGGPSPSVGHCLSALKWVQWMIDLTKRDPSRPDAAIQAIVAWPLVIPDEFITALYQHQPEAFVVLAHYAVMLHKFRDFWVFSSAGAPLFRMIEKHLGDFWADALTWPKMQFGHIS